MKKILFLISIITTFSFLHAEVIKLSLNDDNKLYTDAVKAFDIQDYQTAYNLLETYSKDNVLSTRADFIYARSAYEIGKYEEALASYGKILLSEPNNQRVKLEIAQCYVRINRIDDAKKIFSEVLNEDIPQSVRNNILLTLENIDKKSKKHFLKLITSVAYLFDSNVDNSADAGDYSVYIPSFGTFDLTNSGEKKDDSAVQLIGVLNYNYKVDDNFYLENGFTAFTQRYFEYSEKDINAFSLNISPSYYLKDAKLSVDFIYDYVQINDKNYLKNYTIQPKVNYKLSKQVNYQALVKFNKKDFTQAADEDKSSYVYEFSNIFTLFTNDFGINKFTLNIGDERRREGVRTDVNNNYYLLNYTNSYPLTKTMVLNNSIQYKKTSYEDTDVNFLTKREDTNKQYTIGLLKSINKDLTIGINYQWIDNKSNHAPFDYDKYIAKTFLFYTF